MNQKPKKVLVTNSSIPQIAFELLSKEFEVIRNEENPPTREEILTKLPGIDALFWVSKYRLDKEVLDRAGPQLRVVSSMSVGVDHIDVEEVKSRGILIGNTRNTLDAAVADMAVLLTLSAARRIREGRVLMESGKWENSSLWLLGQDIKHSVVGIVGLGNIGQEIVKRLKAFEVSEFLYAGNKEKPEGASLGARFVSFEKLLKNSDFIIVACPYNNETHGMFNKDAFAKMKTSAIFVNVARGKIVDQEALIEALESGKIFAAGLDVMDPEPLPVNHKMLLLPNCVISPHLGSATLRTRSDMASVAAKNIIEALQNRPMPSPL